MSKSRPPFSERLSEYLPPQDALSAPDMAKAATESTPLLREQSAINSSLSQVSTTTAQATPHTARPALMRAVTSPAAPTTNASIGLTSTPVLSRPMLNRAVTATEVVRTSNIRSRPTCPPLLRRATNVVAASLAFSSQSAQRDQDKPKAPTYWADHIHREPLLQIWDKPGGCIRDTCSIADQLKTAQDEMLRQYAELGSGDVALTKTWIEHVLGLCLRHPFGTSRNAGRWQNLAAAAGPRGNWGPW